MSFPALQVRVAFASDPLAAAPVWVDLTDRVEAFRVRRGRAHELEAVSAGTCSVRLDNRDRALDPTNATSPYAPNVVPRRKLQIRATHGATTYPIFTGYVERWPQDTATVGDATVTVVASDAFKFLNVARLALDSWPVAERDLWSDEAVTWLLDRAGWPAADRAISPGVFEVALEVDQDTAPLGKLQDLARAERGNLFVRADGVVAFWGHNTILEAPYTTSQATFGDGPGELPYLAVLTDYDDTRIYNTVLVTPAGVQPTVLPGSERAEAQYDQRARVEDAASAARYWPSALELTVPLVNLGDAGIVAQAYIDAYAEPQLRVASLDLAWSGDDAVMTQMLARELGDRITVRRRPLGGGTLETPVHLEGITHDFSAYGESWRTTWSLSPVPTGTVLTRGAPSTAAAILRLHEVLYLWETQDDPR